MFIEMERRVFLLILILIFRFILGFLESASYPQNSRIMVTGNIYNIYHNNSKCIITVGRFFVDSRSNCTFSRNDRIQIIGRVNSRVIDRFLGRLWLDSAELVVLTNNANKPSQSKSISSVLSAIRENSVNVYRRYLSVPESGLVAGIVLGYKNDIGQNFYELMVRSGTVHIAVASGYNIMLVGGTVLSICFWIMKRKWASLVAILIMVFYALIAGGEPPVIRAVIMAGAVFGAVLVGRRAISWWILSITGWAMVLIEPWLLVNVSFQLSMAASIGLMIVEPWLRKTLVEWNEQFSEILIGTGIQTTFATMLMTLPIIWLHFGRMSWIGILSNILILPLVPILMITGALMQVFPDVFYWPTYVVAHWMVRVIGFFGD